MRGIVGLFQINGENIQIHTVIRDSNNIRLFHSSVVKLLSSGS